MKLQKLFYFIILILLITLFSLNAQEQYDILANYDKAEYMVPMRDGVRLFTQVYTPKDQSQKYPFV